MQICMDTLDLNPGPSACEADVIPLHHVPNRRRFGHVDIQHKLHKTPSGEGGGPHVHADVIIGKEGSDRVTINTMDVRITDCIGLVVA